MPVRKERPILFSTSMVQAILANRKTQTRRIVRVSDNGFAYLRGKMFDPKLAHHRELMAAWSPYGVAGDGLWVKETHARCPGSTEPGDVAYRADLSLAQEAEERSVRRLMKRSDNPWTPSIFMPRWASRIDLEVTAVRVERLQDITEEDAEVEGVSERRGPIVAGDDYQTAREVYRKLWDKINEGRADWKSNPHVWAVSFRVVKP